MSNFIPNTIFISGATSGIGAALAGRYAEKNKTLILTGRNQHRLNEITNHCKQRGANVIAKVLEITNSSLLTSWLNEIMDDHQIDLVIANAGISSGIDNKGELEPLEKIIEVLNVNLCSVINTIYPILQEMRKRKQGQIALMSSLAAYRGLPQSPAYCASKAGLRAFGESLRALLRREGVFVSIISPGFVKSPMSDRIIGYKPYMISAEMAAIIIQHKLQKKMSEIVFPRRLKLSLNVLNMLPKRLSDLILMNFKHTLTHS